MKKSQMLKKIIKEEVKQALSEAPNQQSQYFDEIAAPLRLFSQLQDAIQDTHHGIVSGLYDDSPRQAEQAARLIEKIEVHIETAEKLFNAVVKRYGEDFKR